jgi:hypothetical protein
MNDLSLEEIETRTGKFIKHIFDSYNNPVMITKFLESVFEKKGVYCGFTWVPGDEYYGQINVVYMSSDDIFERKRKIMHSAHLRDLLTHKLLLHEFIYHVWNPQGILMLEKIMFELEG